MTANFGTLLAREREPEIDSMTAASLVVIVDDDEPVRIATESLVRSLGYASTTFASAEEFLRPPDVDRARCLITDIQMPGMLGIELQNVMIRQGLRISVIFMTAYPEDHWRERVMAAGAAGFLSKPFDVEDLLECLEKALH